MLAFATALILIFGIINLIRLAVFMVAADIYDIKQKKVISKKKVKSWPKMSILIPAYNEELTIEKTIVSVIKADYSNKEIIVIDDGSSDDTSQVVDKTKSIFPKANLKLLRQENAGKGAALNKGISEASGELVMVLDADSTIAEDALTNSVKYFLDKRVKAVASNVTLIDNGSWLGLIQRIEYMLSYRMKRSLTTLNIEYIIGGVGSVYRMSTLKQVSGYRTSTITEDIDLSMKVVARGNKAYRVIYASDVRTQTEPVHKFKELISQRYRWKLGRLQSFIRYRKLFFTKHKKHGKVLAWFQLPYAIFGEIYLLLEPLFYAVIIYVTIAYGDISALPMAILVISIFLAFNIIATESESFKDKLALLYMLPLIYALLPVLAFVELASLYKCAVNWRRISPTYKGAGHWKHVSRKPASAVR